MGKSVLVPVADGSEDLEFSTITDILTRAGSKVVTASVMDRREVVLARGLRVVADRRIEEVMHDHYDAMLVPGGMPGAEFIGKSTDAGRMAGHLRRHGRLVGGICAAPAATFTADAFKNMYNGVPQAAVYPSPKFEQALRQRGVDVTEAPVVYSGGLLTSRGPGTAAAFALKAVALLYTEEKAKEVAESMLLSTARL
eukprot:TRINITY_DN11797_c0_g2_i1.p2 TRINITY_DN11797_c0_g2~~TRINITY_DN11797_c0_g2_i1.p2  ORF type:complete len:197 (+),score=68.84 TRINITY_DN11797_c0_g2_i1:69-659(+)